VSKKKANDKPVITQTLLNTWWRCPRLAYYQYWAGGCGVETTSPHIPFIEGNLGHYALQHWFKSARMLKENLVKRVTKQIEAEGAMNVEMANTLDMKMAALVGACLGYKDHYRDMDSKYEILYIEEPFSIDMGTFKLEGKIDLITRDPEGRLTIWEHKFVSSAAAYNYQTLPIDLQGMLYCLGCEAITGEIPQMRQWNIIIKSQLKRKKIGGRVETKDEFTDRVMQQYIDEPDKKFYRPPAIPVETKILETLIERLKVSINAMLKNLEDNYYEVRLGSCKGMYGQPCDFVPACTELLDGQKDGWDAPKCAGSYRKKETQHPELKGD